MIPTTLRFTVGRLAVLAAMAAVTCWSLETSAEQANLRSEPREGFLVLHNGEVFRGKIIQVGDRHVVTVPGGQVSVKSSDVEACCVSLKEAYPLRKRYHPCHYVTDHLQLAQWCQRHGLLEEADEELAAAKSLNPTHPMIPLLERRIKTQREGVEVRAPMAIVAEAQISSGDLERLVREIPPGTMESFTQTIQPMLLNRCTTAGCHGPGTSARLSLTRIPPTGPSNRKTTQRNLHAVLEWVNRANPAASPLLTQPMRPHGTCKTPVFTDHQAAQVEQLVDWVRRVSQAPEPPAPVQQASHLEGHESPPPVAPAVYTEPAASAGEEAFPAPGELTPSPLKPGVKRGTPPKEFVPVDPFDAQIFNRRFLSTEAKSSAGEPPR